MKSLLPSKLYNKNFILLWQGQLVSQLGSQASAIALMLGLKHLTQSASLIGTMLMGIAISSIVIGPLAGVVADLFSRKWIMVITDLVSGVFLLGLSSLLLLGIGSTQLVVAAMVITELVVATTRLFFSSAITASIPSLVPAQQLTSANSIITSTSTFVWLVGNGLGGILFTLLGAPLLFLLDGLSYLVSGLASLFLQVPPIGSVHSVQRVTLKGIWATLIEGLHYLWQRVELRVLVLVKMTSSFFIAPLEVIFPFIVEDYLHLSAEWYGFFMAAMGVGSLLGLGAAGFLKVNQPWKGRLMIGVILLEAVPLLLLGLVTQPYVILGLLVVVGACSSYVGMQLMSLLQLSTPSELRGRMVGNFLTLTAVLMPLSLALTGLLVDLVGQRLNLILLGCGLMIGLTQVPLVLNKSFLAFLDRSFSEPIQDKSLDKEEVAAMEMPLK